MLIIALVYIKINDFCGIILFEETREINVLYYEVWFMDKKKFNFKDMTKNAISYSKQK